MQDNIETPLKVLWTGAVSDLSGYGSASREYVRSLDAVGVDVAVDARSFEPWKPSNLVEDLLDARMYALMSKDRSIPYHVIHLTPDNYREYANNNKVRIGYFAWETSLLPPSWVKYINNIVREVWVPCQYLADVSYNSGVKVPVFVIPHAIPIPSSDWQPKSTLKLPSDKYKFYSIFQWSNRKNASNLITAYYQEFSRKDPVCLVLKTYRSNQSISERQLVRNEIAKLKRSTKGNDCPPIILVEDLLTSNDVLSVHHFCDCYISMARSEGFGIPAFEAASMGNPVIVPNYSAFPEYLSEETAYLINVPSEIPVKDMGHISPLYTGNMLWGDPSIESCRDKMREAFVNQKRAKEKGLAAREFVKANLNYNVIGRLMKWRLESIHQEVLEGMR